MGEISTHGLKVGDAIEIYRNGWTPDFRTIICEGVSGLESVFSMSTFLNELDPHEYMLAKDVVRLQKP